MVAAYHGSVAISMDRRKTKMAKLKLRIEAVLQPLLQPARGLPEQGREAPTAQALAPSPGTCLDSCSGALDRDDAKDAKKHQVAMVDTTRSVIKRMRKLELITEGYNEAFEQVFNSPARHEKAKPPPEP